ncbi:PREDICTED: protein CEI [Capra hircus]|uniref:protein CEI n=1 Tax=Capra hircus TaxID=9925 RepID=UPI000846D51C|nr:PREDICTED: protein CEI [Capra hircus]
MVGAGRGGPRHAEQRAGRAAPSIHARPGREAAAAAGAGTASRGRPARALARAAPRARGSARRRRRRRRRRLGAAALTPTSPGPLLLAARAEPPRGTSRLAAGPAPPGVPCGTRIPGASVASRQEGPEHSGETIVTGQTASGRTWSLAVTREGTRQSQAGGAGGARGCPDPRRPVVNCRIGLEQSPPASTCRRWPPVADAFGTSWRGHACFREPRFPGGRALGNGGLGLEVLLGKQRRRRPRRPPLLARGSREAGRPSGDAARSRARGRRGGAVARGCRLVPAAVGLVPSPATEGAPAGPPQRRLHSGQRDSNPGAFE